MTSYKDLLKQRDELEKRIQDARKRELAEAVSQVRTLIEEHGLSPSDIFPSSRGSRSTGAGAKVAPKYKNPETGETWTGRGKAPKWIQDKDRSQYQI